jgi:hypothetical protein
MIQGKTKISTNIYLIIHMVGIRVLILIEEMKIVAIIKFMPKVKKPSYKPHIFDTCIMCQMHRHIAFRKNTSAIISTNLQPPKKKLS